MTIKWLLFAKNFFHEINDNNKFVGHTKVNFPLLYNLQCLCVPGDCQKS